MNNTNYYFISSPLHLMFSANQAILNKDDENIAVINSYIPRNFSLFSETIKKNKQIFSGLIEFDLPGSGSKYKIRKKRMLQIKNSLTEKPASKVFTGSDRNVEFQFAMHVASQQNRNVQGIYLDEGTQTYLGHKHMHTCQHKYIDPFLKKITYGHWWKNPLIIGASDWITTLYASFPEHVHKVLKGKNILPVQHKPFETEEFLAFADSLLKEQAFDTDSISNVKCVLILTNDSYYEDFWSHFSLLIKEVREMFQDNEIAVKAHPRSKFLEELTQKYPSLVHLDNRVGFEFLLPKFKSNCTYIGDVSSALFTIKWFNSESPVYAVKIDQDAPAHFEKPLQKLFSYADIPTLAISQLTEYLLNKRI